MLTYSRVTLSTSIRVAVGEIAGMVVVESSMNVVAKLKPAARPFKSRTGASFTAAKNSMAFTGRLWLVPSETTKVNTLVFGVGLLELWFSYIRDPNTVS